jgi:thiol-disulfide isomerase/thioredoxin
MDKSFRKISKDKYIIAGIITFLIFSLGITLGMIIDNQRYSLIEEVNMEQEVNYLSLQMQHLYLNSFSAGDNCPVVETALKSAVTDLSDSLSEVIAYEEELDTKSKRKDLVMRRYLLDNLRYWILAQDSMSRCDFDIVPILYFYAKDCPSCPNQGTILTYFKEKFGEKVLIFPINLDFRNSEPMVQIAMEQFKVTKYPTLVINDKRYEGVVSREVLEGIICDSLEDATECQS